MNFKNVSLVGCLRSREVYLIADIDPSKGVPIYDMGKVELKLNELNGHNDRNITFKDTLFSLGDDASDLGPLYMTIDCLGVNGVIRVPKLYFSDVLKGRKYVNITKGFYDFASEYLGVDKGQILHSFFGVGPSVRVVMECEYRRGKELEDRNLCPHSISFLSGNEGERYFWYSEFKSLDGERANMAFNLGLFKGSVDEDNLPIPFSFMTSIYNANFYDLGPNFYSIMTFVFYGITGEIVEPNYTFKYKSYLKD